MSCSGTGTAPSAPGAAERAVVQGNGAGVFQGHRGFIRAGLSPHTCLGSFQQHVKHVHMHFHAVCNISPLLDSLQSKSVSLVLFTYYTPINEFTSALDKKN